MKTVCVVVCFGLLAAPAWGQLMGKVPPAPPPTPEYVPPPPPQPVTPPKPVEPEKPVPTLAVKAPDGKVIRYPVGPERAAVEQYPFDDAARTKIAASDAKRNAELERQVLEKLDAVLEARRRLKTIDQVKTINEFDQAKQTAAPLQVEKFSDRLLRDGAITPAQHSRIDQMVKEYEAAIGQEVRSDPKFDVQNIFNAVAAMSFEKGTRDMLAAFDRLAVRGVAALPGALPELGLEADQKAALGASPDVEALVLNLNTEQLRQLLGKCLSGETPG